MTHEEAMTKARELAKLPDAERLSGLRALSTQDALHTLAAAMVIGLNETVSAKEKAREESWKKARQE